jgi:hypothetical protein
LASEAGSLFAETADRSLRAASLPQPAANGMPGGQAERGMIAKGKVCRCLSPSLTEVLTTLTSRMPLPNPVVLAQLTRVSAVSTRWSAQVLALVKERRLEFYRGLGYYVSGPWL